MAAGLGGRSGVAKAGIALPASATADAAMKEPVHALVQIRLLFEMK